MKKKRKSVEKEKLLKANQKNFGSWLSILIYFLIACFLFRGIFNLDQAIVSSDTPVTSHMIGKESLRNFSLVRWHPYNFAGNYWFADVLYLPRLVFMFLFEPHFAIGFEYLFNVFLAGTFMFLFMRSLEINRLPAFIAGLSFMLTNHLVSLVYPGHMGKMDSYCWTPLIFLFYLKGLRTGEIENFLLAGAFYGIFIMAGEVQVTYYIGLVLAAYTLCYLISNYFRQRRLTFTLKLTGYSLLTVAIAVIFSLQMFTGFLSGRQGLEPVVREDDPEAKYEFATSWSFPPEEILTFFMRRPFGNMTGDVENEYWGRMGSSQMILKQTDDYIGVIPLLLVLISIFFVNKRKTLFWIIIALIALIISFGKFTPVYKIVYKLPMMSQFRVPAKWIFIVVFSVAILVGYGAQYLYDIAEKICKKEDKNTETKKIKFFSIFLITLCILSLIIAILGSLWKETFVAKITNLVARKNNTLTYDIILDRYETMLLSFWRFVLLFILSSFLIVLWFHSVNKTKWRFYFFCILAFIILWDVGGSASYFIQYYDYRAYYAPEEITNFLKSDPEVYFRVKLLSRTPILEHLQQAQFQYHKIFCFDAAASRLPLRYRKFFEAVNENFTAFLNIFNIKYLLSDRPIFLHPSIKEVFKASYKTLSGVQEIYVYKYFDYVPRVFTNSKYKIISDEQELLTYMNNPEFNLRDAVLLQEQPNIPSTSISTYNSQSAVIKHYEPNKVEIDVNSQQPTILVLADYYDERWRAYINNKETKIYPAYYLLRAVVVPAGHHSVTFVFRPNMVGFYITLFSWFVFIGFGSFLLKIKSRAIKK